MPAYTAYGLTVASDILLPDLPPAAGDAQVTVRYAEVEDRESPDTHSERVFHRTPGGILLHWRDYANFLVRNGSEVLVEPAPGASDLIIRHLLMGPVFALLNFQRGRNVFHASAVTFSEAGIAFMGGKGYGKSTQAAAFVQQGCTLITDDVLALIAEPSGLWAVPGIPFLKLWPEAVTSLGGDPVALPLVKENLDKRTLSMKAHFAAQPVPLRAVFLLDHGQKVDIQRYTPNEALRRVMPHWYGSLFDGELLPVLGIERQFWDCTNLVQRVPVYNLKRPVSLEHLSEIYQAVQCVL